MGKASTIPLQALPAPGFERGCRAPSEPPVPTGNPVRAEIEELAPIVVGQAIELESRLWDEEDADDLSDHPACLALRRPR